MHFFHPLLENFQFPISDHLQFSWWNFGYFIYKAGFLGVITRLRVGLALLRDSPKPRPYINLSIQGSGHGIGISPEAKLKGGCEGEGAFDGTRLLCINHQLIWR